MEQIRQILEQMALNLELNIAMCDKIDSLEKRLDKLDPIIKSHGTKIDSLATRISEMSYSAAAKAYEERTGKKPYK
ncbi:MAG: hypothetical protein E7465_06895 [Ruminococcaceae bacterium]|nr:hypothetical protein [Oscillospiraceae bacterium]